MATITWDGSESGGVFTNGANWVGGTAPASGDSIVFDDTSNGALGNNCAISALTISSSEQYHDITIASTYTGAITFSNTLDVRLDGALLVHKENTLKGAGTTTFTFLGAPTVDTYDGAGETYTKALVNFTTDTSVWNDGRDTFTFNFGSQTFSMVDGVYPNITFTGTLKAKKIYSDASRTEFNNYGSVDMLDFSGGLVNSTNYDIYDYTKEFLFEGTLTGIGETFRFGHTTARFKTLKTSSYGALNFPVSGSSIFAATATKNFYAQYHKLVIETNDVIDNYWLIPAGLTIECNELVIKDGGRIYGSVGTDVKAATIKSVKRPTIRGDWNFRQIADGVYETIGGISNTPVYHGGTGRQTLTKNALLYGNGMDSVNMLGIGTAGKYLKVNSGETGYEWADASGGGGIGGSSVNTRIAFGDTTADEITSNSNLYYSSGKLYSLGGGIETNGLKLGMTYTGAGAVIENGGPGNDPVILRGNSSSGSLSTGAGSSSDFVITPSASGKIKISKVEFGGNWNITDSVPTANGQVLTGQTDGSTAWSTVSGGGSANDSTITLSAGTGLSTGGDFTTNQSSDETITFNVSGLTVSELAADSLQTSGEAFANNDTSLMTSAAIEDKITTQVATILAANISPLPYERRSLGNNTGKIGVAGNNTSAVAFGYPMPLGGKVKRVSFLFQGGSITDTNNNVFRVIKNTDTVGNYVEVGVAADALINKGASGEYLYTFSADLTSSSLVFSAGDLLWVTRHSGDTDLQHCQVVLWIGI